MTGLNEKESMYDIDCGISESVACLYGPFYRHKFCILTAR